MCISVSQKQWYCGWPSPICWFRWFIVLCSIGLSQFCNNATIFSILIFLIHLPNSWIASTASILHFYFLNSALISIWCILKYSWTNFLSLLPSPSIFAAQDSKRGTGTLWTIGDVVFCVQNFCVKASLIKEYIYLLNHSSLFLYHL